VDEFPGAAGEIDRTAVTVLDPGFPQPDAITPRNRGNLYRSHKHLFFLNLAGSWRYVRFSGLPQTCFRTLL
jgi:hypothetical protein